MKFSPTVDRPARWERVRSLLLPGTSLATRVCRKRIRLWLLWKARLGPHGWRLLLIAAHPAGAALRGARRLASLLRLLRSSLARQCSGRPEDGIHMFNENTSHSLHRTDDSPVS